MGFISFIFIISLAFVFIYFVFIDIPVADSMMIKQINKEKINEEIKRLEEISVEKYQALFWVSLESKSLKKKDIVDNFNLNDFRLVHQSLIKEDEHSDKILGFFSEKIKQHRSTFLETISEIPLDNLSGKQFEVFLMNNLERLGATNLSLTKASGDQGGDVLFFFNGRKSIIQAKRWKGVVGNSAVQEVFAAKSFYNCDQAFVITTSYYSSSAKQLAEKLNVKLIDGISLKNLSLFIK